MMKPLFLLLIFGLTVLTFSQKVTVTESFSETKSYPDSHHGNDNGNGNDDGNSGSGSERRPGPGPGPGTTPPVNPGADNYNACNPNNRPEACTREYVPVCGYIDECEGGACTSTFSNSCTACATSDVNGYVNGACEDVRTNCDPNDRPNACPLIYTATCAVASDCQGSRCFENVANSCLACSIQGVAYSLPGECPGDDDTSERVYCDPQNRPEICTADYTPVCAHTSSCLGDSCWNTAGNACSACSTENVDYHYPGECSDDEEDDGRTYCDADNRPEICTADYNPVCAHTSNCEGDNCWNTAGNACSACGDVNVDYHIPGECPDDDDDDDERTYCNADNRPVICTADFTPVCAHTSNCEGDNCWNTAGNACSACTDVNVDYHVPGECDDDA